MYIYTLSLFLSLSLSPHLILPRLEAFVYQHGIDAGIISVDSGSEITVPLIPPRFSSDDCPSTPFVTRTRATPSVHSVYVVCTCVCEKKKKYFYLNYRWESNIFDIINLSRLECTRTGAMHFSLLFLSPSPTLSCSAFLSFSSTHFSLSFFLSSFLPSLSSLPLPFSFSPFSF